MIWWCHNSIVVIASFVVVVSSSDATFARMRSQPLTTRHQNAASFNGINHRNNAPLALEIRSGASSTANGRPQNDAASSHISTAALYMAGSMAFPLGGYEFLRSAGLTTFTSGFPNSNQASLAFSLVNVAVTPVSIFCLGLYTRQIHRSGPRNTLRQSIALCMAIILGIVLTLSSRILPPRLQQTMVAAAFVFQNTYVSLLTSQQWSFLDSVVTPRQGARWFGAMTGLGSVAGTITASLVPRLVPTTGLMGLYLFTALSLLGAYICADRAYALAQHQDLDPATHDISENSRISSKKPNSLGHAWGLVRRIPTLRALFVEGLVFQIFLTIVNFATMRALQIAYAHEDATRSSLTGQFYAVLNGMAAVGQFLVLPFLMNHCEVKQIWRSIAILPFLATAVHGAVVFGATKTVIENSSMLGMLAAILFTSQVTDYSVRSVICNVAYQPLDYESRYIGKEFIGVFANRLGRSGMSLFLMAMTGILGWRSGSMDNDRHMNILLTWLLVATCSLWMGSTWWLGRFVPTNAAAQQIVEDRRKK